MFTLLLVLLVLDSVVLIAAVLLQAGKGGGLAATFGGAASSTDAFVGMRQAANLLTRLSWWCGGLFLLLGFVLSIMSVRASAPRSVLDQPFSQPATGNTPASKTAPAVPLEPATKAPQPQTGKAPPPSGKAPAPDAAANKSPSPPTKKTPQP